MLCRLVYCSVDFAVPTDAYGLGCYAVLLLKYLTFISSRGEQTTGQLDNTLTSLAMSETSGGQFEFSFILSCTKTCVY